MEESMDVGSLPVMLPNEKEGKWRDLTNKLVLHLAHAGRELSVEELVEIRQWEARHSEDALDNFKLLITEVVGFRQESCQGDGNPSIRPTTNIIW